MSIFALALLYIHKFLSPSVDLIETVGELSLYLYTAIILYSIIFLAGWLTSRIKILRDLKKVLEKIFKHEISVWLHRLNIIATVLGFIHVLLIDYIINVKLFFALFLIYTFFTFVSYGIFVYKKTKLKKAKITGIRVLNGNTVEVEIGNLTNTNGINTGDFCYITFDKEKMKEPHPFSIQNFPKKDGKIKFAIEMVGDFTKKLKDIEIGTTVKYSKGYGVLHKFLKNNNRKVVFIGGGAGVVPLLSMAEEFEKKRYNIFIFFKKR